MKITVDTVYAGAFTVGGDDASGYFLSYRPERAQHDACFIEGLDTLDLVELIEALTMLTDRDMHFTIPADQSAPAPVAG